MKIYAVADIHAKTDKISAIRENILKYNPDVLIVAGDITNFIYPSRTLALLNKMPVPVLIIRGNSDLKKLERILYLYPNITSLHLNSVTVKDVYFTGISGTLPIPFDSRIAFNEKEIIEKAESFLKYLNKPCVLVAHPPPKGILDKVLGKFHAGCKALYKLILKYQPALMICGHIHEYAGTSFIGKTQIVNCSVGRQGIGFIIEINDKIRINDLQSECL